jgi:hypothetical protein
METYNIVRDHDGWAVSHNQAAAEGSYATREGALEAVYLAATNDIKRGAAITIVVEAPASGKSAIGSTTN